MKKIKINLQYDERKVNDEKFQSGLEELLHKHIADECSAPIKFQMEEENISDIEEISFAKSSVIDKMLIMKPFTSKKEAIELVKNHLELIGELSSDDKIDNSLIKNIWIAKNEKSGIHFRSHAFNDQAFSVLAYPVE